MPVFAVCRRVNFVFYRGSVSCYCGFPRGNQNAGRQTARREWGERTFFVEALLGKYEMLSAISNIRKKH
jgi:hypothetical protein